MQQKAPELWKPSRNYGKYKTLVFFCKHSQAGRCWPGSSKSCKCAHNLHLACHGPCWNTVTKPSEAQDIWQRKGGPDKPEGCSTKLPKLRYFLYQWYAVFMGFVQIKHETSWNSTLGLYVSFCLQAMNFLHENHWRDVPSRSSLLSDLGGLILEVFLTEPFSIRMGSRGCQTVEDILREDSGEKETSYDLWSKDLYTAKHFSAKTKTLRASPVSSKFSGSET